jgi:hypothetical protein
MITVIEILLTASAESTTTVQEYQFLTTTISIYIFKKMNNMPLYSNKLIF